MNLVGVCVCACDARLCVTPWTVAHQAALSMGFSWQEYWSGLPFPSPGDLPDPGIKPMSLTSPTLTGGFFITEPSGNPMDLKVWILILSLNSFPVLLSSKKLDELSVKYWTWRICQKKNLNFLLQSLSKKC